MFELQDHSLDEGYIYIYMLPPPQRSTFFVFCYRQKVGFGGEPYIPLFKNQGFGGMRKITETPCKYQ